MGTTNSVVMTEELRQHILHMRREITREDRSPFKVRQKLAQLVTDLLNAPGLVPAQQDAGFRCRPKDSGPDTAWDYIHHRAPDDFELREFEIQPLVATVSQHQQRMTQDNQPPAMELAVPEGAPLTFAGQAQVQGVSLPCFR